MADENAKPETKPVEKQADKATPAAKPQAGAAPAKPETKPAQSAPAKPAETDAPPKPAETEPAAKPETKPAPKPAPAAKPQAGAAPAKPETKPAEKPAPAEPQLPAFEKGLSDKIVGQFGERAQVRFVKPDRVGIKVAREDVREVASYLRDQMNFDHAESVTGVDYPADKEIEVVYHLGSYTDESLSRQVLELATRAPREEVPSPGRDSTVLPSLREVFYSVEFHERECFEMLGVYFEDHPDNRRLLLPEDWADIPPMRKDFAIKGR